MRVRRRTRLLALLLVAFLLPDGFLLLRRGRYREESLRLRAGMTELEQKRADAIVAADADQAALMIEFLRRLAQGDETIHLAVNTDSGYVALDGAGWTGPQAVLTTGGTLLHSRSWSPLRTAGCGTSAEPACASRPR